MMRTRSFKFSPELMDRISEVRSAIVDSCEECDGSGYVPAEKSGSVHRCDCMVIFRYVKELMKAGIVSDYWSLTLADLDIDISTKKMVQLYVKNLENAKSRGLGMLLLGANGIGKTSLMAEIGKEAIVNGYSVRYVTLSTYLKALFDKDREAIENIERGEFLLVDELDKKQGKFADAVDSFLRSMFSQNKSLILGTNWNEDEIGEKLGQSIHSLLKRRCEFIEMEGEDYSDKLQEEYLKALTSPFEYWHENIVKMAMRREKNVYV